MITQFTNRRQTQNYAMQTVYRSARQASTFRGGEDVKAGFERCPNPDGETILLKNPEKS